MELAKLYRFLKSDLQDIEKRLANSIDAEHPILKEASLKLLQAGGKRIRPAFVLLSAQFGDYEKYEKQVKTVAVAIELIHMATLVHDDVVDDSELRRGQPTVKQLYGNRVAMYTGDYLLARALELITTIEEPMIHRILSKTLVKVVEGEIDQIEDKFRLDQELKQYLRRIKRKTALLIATSCKLGAIASGTTKQDANKLYRYGLNIGMSFQIIDDVLDFTATPEQLGKPTGSDLLQGNVTLPIFFAMRDQTFANKMEKYFVNGEQINEENIGSILKQLKETDAIERAYEMSEQYLQKSKQSIAELPHTNAWNTLQTIAQIIGTRKF